MTMSSAAAARTTSAHRGIRIRAEGQGEIRHEAALDLLGRLGPGSAGAVIADPPFFVSAGRAANWSEQCGQGQDPWATDVSSIDEMVAWSVPLADQIARSLRPGGACVMMGSSQSISAWEVAAQRAGLIWMAELVVMWNTGKPRQRKFGSLTTLIRWHAKPGLRHTFNSGDAKSIYSNVLVCDKVPVAERSHPAQKPVELTNFFVSLLTKRDDLVVDPFCGSGSTLVSAAMCGRPWLGGDTDFAYCQTAELRTKRIELEEANLRPLYLWVNCNLIPVEG